MGLIQSEQRWSRNAYWYKSRNTPGKFSKSWTRCRRGWLLKPPSREQLAQVVTRVLEE